MSLETIAKNLAAKGRGGDSVLVHMSPSEVRGLQQLAQMHGTSLTINPYTGMPEALSLKKAFKSVGNVFKSVVKPIAKVLKPIAPILPFIPIPGIAGLSPLLTKSILSGVLGGYGGKGGFDLKRGLMSGLMNYGIGSLAQGFGSAGSTPGSVGGTPTSYMDVPGGVAGVEPGIGNIASGTGSPLPQGGTVIASELGDVYQSATPGGFTTASTPATGFKAELPTGSSPLDYLKQTGENITAAGKGAYNMLTGTPGATSTFKENLPINPLTDKPMSPSALGGTAFMGYSGVKTLDELETQKAEAERIIANLQNEQEERIQYARNILQNYPLLYKQLSAQDVRSMNLASGGVASFDDELGQDGYAAGGITALMGGGLPPRYLSGGGDGMSDSIKANIAGKQEARLADGEFVVPADVVSHIGNGSSNAGAKKLYAMMDRVRQARTGKKQQAPAINAMRAMPA